MKHSEGKRRKRVHALVVASVGRLRGVYLYYNKDVIELRPDHYKERAVNIAVKLESLKRTLGVKRHGGVSVFKDDQHHVISEMPLALQLKNVNMMIIKKARDTLNVGKNDTHLLGVLGLEGQHRRYVEHNFLSAEICVDTVLAGAAICNVDIREELVTLTYL